MGIKPEDILPDDESFADLNGVTVRKGTVAAALANAEILNSNTATDAQKKQAIAMIIQLAPSLVALNLHKHVI